MKNHGSIDILPKLWQNKIKRLKYAISLIEKYSWGHIGAFGVKWGEISMVTKSYKIICQNKALNVAISKNVVWPSPRLTRIQKLKKKSNFDHRRK